MMKKGNHGFNHHRRSIFYTSPAAYSLRHFMPPKNNSLTGLLFCVLLPYNYNHSVVFRLVGSNPEELAQTHTRRKSGVFFYGPAIIYGHVRKPKNFSHERKERKTERTFTPLYRLGMEGGNSRRLHIYGLELRHVCGRFYYDVMSSSHEYFRRYKSHTHTARLKVSF